VTTARCLGAGLHSTFPICFRFFSPVICCLLSNLFGDLGRLFSSSCSLAAIAFHSNQVWWRVSSRLLRWVSLRPLHTPGNSKSFPRNSQSPFARTQSAISSPSSASNCEARFTLRLWAPLPISGSTPKSQWCHPPTTGLRPPLKISDLGHLVAPAIAPCTNRIH
jgi:hypothetical protein